MWRSRLWSISWLHHQMFYPYVTISAAQARKSDDLRHAMSPFSLFLSSFSGTQTNLGIWEATKDCSGASSKNREKTEHLEELSDCDSLHASLLLRRMQTLNWDTANVSQLHWNQGCRLISCLFTFRAVKKYPMQYQIFYVYMILVAKFIQDRKIL